jgi:chromosome segregation protein
MPHLGIIGKSPVRLTRLRLNGFKSFVDPTDLVIHEGLTGVVGPNGCGKSNLLEALRWVMGENRPTAMRGGGMEDVIFAGAATRPARHYAEVSLVIDNTERLAPAGFNDADTLEIARRITREAGSAYRANGREMRARDVQMLFADAATGSHSPALVRQGQISELINAKPRARRKVLEDAAGIGGLYQRRHEAELRLTATEQNLARVDDVLENLAQQLAALARQAKQAARYREIAEALRAAEGMLLYLRWRDSGMALEGAEATLRNAVMAAGQAEIAARAAAAAREQAEVALPPLREEEAIAGAVLQRLALQDQSLTEAEARALAAIDTLTSRIAQIDRDAERETTLNSDAGETISRLEWEIAQLHKAQDGHESRLAEAAEAARAAGAFLADGEALLSQATEDAARLAARHQSAERLLSDTTTAVARAEADAGRAAQAVQDADDAVATAESAFETATVASAAAQDLATRADDTLTATEAARADVAGREADSRAARSAAEGEANALRAEVAALTRLVAREAQGGTLLIDRLTVVPGYEAAIGAALADDLRAPETDGASGWATLPPYADPPALPAGATPLSSFVTAPAVLARRLSQTGLIDRADGAVLQVRLGPGQRLVSRDGDLWRWDGFRAGADDTPSATALRLQQMNRLRALEVDLQVAQTRATDTRLTHEALQTRLQDLTRADQAARDARRAADVRLAEASRALSRAEADRALSTGKRDVALQSVSRTEDEAMAARARRADAQAAMGDLPDLSRARTALEDAKVAVEGARVAMLSRRSAHDELRREGEARVRRRQSAMQELSGWKNRLDSAGKRLAELEERRITAIAELEKAEAAPSVIAAERGRLTDAMHEAEARRRAATDRLTEGETALRGAQTSERDAERAAGEAREARDRAETPRDGAAEGVAIATRRIADDLETTPEGLQSALPLNDRLPAAEDLDTEVGRLRRQREALGAVNLRAEEDAIAVQTEHDTLAAEKADLEEAVRKLRAGISGLNKEGRERLLTAFEQVNTNFTMLFKHLFGGGEARLVLVESDDPLEAGLEIMCQPPGKKLATLSLLSGGEQTLTALALIFGVFLANPAPICVLDEVDAPLDDANVTRFCDLLDEMTRRTETRFLIITHHAVTMARMDRLFGVTMAEQGVSQLVSVDLKRAAAMVA